MGDFFYIGYHDRADCATAKRIVIIASVLLLAFLSIGFYWTGILSDAADGVYEFGLVQSWSGTIELSPYPTLIIENEDGSAREVLLVASFKHRADELVREFQGRSVELRGTRIARNGITMIELTSDPITVTNQVVMGLPNTPIEGERITARGKIVDSKCWLGVMNPGEGIVHRGCANLCIRGGIPPIFVFQDSGGLMQYALLHSSSGDLATDILPVVARPVSLSGRFVSAGSGRLARFEIDSLP